MEQNGRKDGYLHKMVFADGKVDRLAFPGVWDIRIDTLQPVSAAAYMRAVKSLALAVEGLVMEEGMLVFGEVRIVNKNNYLAIELIKSGTQYQAIVYIGYDFLFIDRFKQRKIIKQTILQREKLDIKRKKDKDILPVHL